MFLGIDIGSTTSKAVILDGDGNLAASAVQSTGAGTRGPEIAVARALAAAGIDEGELSYTVATGYGRIVYARADRQVTEISCHAKAIAGLYPAARTLIDIGGQDAKVIRLNPAGGVAHFVMNEKCAAGTGRFLEVMARILDCGIDQLSDLSAGATRAISISSTCTVFAESEVISQLAAGACSADVASGAHRAVAKRVAGLAGRIGIAGQVVMSGGVALNRSLVAALEDEIGESITVAENPQIMGALGAAGYARHDFQSSADKGGDGGR